MSEDKKGAILQRDGATYAIVPRTPVGLVSADMLEKIAEVVRKYKVPIIKVTSGQRLALVGIREEEIEQVWTDLGMEIGRALDLCVHYVQACPGTTVCRLGMQDSLGLGRELENLFYDFELPAKLKMGVSGCSMCCGESFVRDIGLVGKKKGWTLAFGGNAGNRPRVGDVLAEGMGREEVIDLVSKILVYYRDHAKKKERTARFIERTGIQAMKTHLGL
jgi:NAD(P)H-nitrite reductase large subunit